MIPKLIGSNSESSLSKPSMGLDRSVINVIKNYDGYLVTLRHGEPIDTGYTASRVSLVTSMELAVQCHLSPLCYLSAVLSSTPYIFPIKSKPKPNFNDFLHTDKQVLLPRHFDIIQKFPLYIGHIFFNSTRSESVHSSSS